MNRNKTKYIENEDSEKQRDLFLKIIETNPLAITVLNKNGEITFANSAAEKMLRLKKDEITQRKYNAPEWQIVDIDGGDFPDEQLPFNLVKTKQESVFNIKHSIKTADGKTIPLSINASPLFAEVGTFDGVVAVLENISEKVERESILTERMKELQCLYNISKIEKREELSLEELFQETVEIMRDSWLYPEITCARIIFEGKEYKTDNFKETEWKQSADIEINNEKIGEVEIRYLEKMPERDEGPFLKEERELIEEIAYILERNVDRRIAVEALNGNYKAALNILEDLHNENEIRKKTEKELREKEKILTRSQEIGGTGSYVWDIKKGEIYFSENLYKMLGIDSSEYVSSLSKLILKYVVSEDRAPVIEQLKQMAKEKRNWPLEFRVIKPDGEIRTWRSLAEFIFDKDGKIVRTIGVINDVTEQKIIESNLQSSYERLRAYAMHLQTVREEERKAIARDLHDELGHVLSATNMNLTYIERALIPKDNSKQTKEIREEIKQMRNIITQSSQKVKSMITELRPEIIEDMPLYEALEWFIDEYRKRRKFTINYSSNLRELYLPSNESTTIFRVLQEALSNIFTHSEASEVDVDFKSSSDDIILKIEDDGVGFKEEGIDKKKSFGILGMEERMFSIGGEIEIKSEIGKGTTIEARISKSKAFASKSGKEER